MHVIKEHSLYYQVVVFYFSIIINIKRYTSINDKNDELLHEVIISVGYFTVINEDNQVPITNLCTKTHEKMFQLTLDLL